MKHSWLRRHRTARAAYSKVRITAPSAQASQLVTVALSYIPGEIQWQGATLIPAMNYVFTAIGTRAKDDLVLLSVILTEGGDAAKAVEEIIKALKIEQEDVERLDK